MASPQATAALALFGIAHALRILRLNICLGGHRMPFRNLVALHCAGIALSYRVFPACFYEMLMMAGGTLHRRDSALPLLFSLCILRLFDALTLAGIWLLTPMTDAPVRPVVAALLGVALLCWFGIAALPPLLLRMERRLLTWPGSAGSPLALLGATHAFRAGLGALSWRKRGTVSLVLVLSVLAWALEWQTLALQTGSALAGASAILARVGRSLGFDMPAADGYGATAVAMCLFAAISSLYALYRVWRPRHA